MVSAMTVHSVFGVVFTSFFHLLLCTRVHCGQINTSLWRDWFDKQCFTYLCIMNLCYLREHHS